MELPYITLPQVSTLLDKEEAVSLRLVNRDWYRIITPGLCHTLIYDPLEKDQESHKAFLKKYGPCAKKLTFGFLGLGNVFTFSEAEVEFLASAFPKLTALEFNICEDNPERCALALLEFSKSLPRLKHLELRGVVDGAILKLINPIISKLKVLSLGNIIHRDGSKNSLNDNVINLLPHLELPATKELKFFEKKDTCFYSMLAQEFTGLDSLFYCWNYDRNDSWILIDVKNFIISQTRLSLNSGLQVSINFDIAGFRPKRRMDAMSLTGQLDYIKNSFKADEDNPASNVTLPPIQSLCLQANYYGNDLVEFIKLCTDVPSMVLTFRESEGNFEFPQVELGCRRLVLKDFKGLPSLLWANKWLPNLSEFYFNATVKEEEFENSELNFKPLVHFYTNHVQPPSFWKRLIETSKELRQIMCGKEDPSFEQLRKDHPEISFGFWSTELQEQLEVIGVFNHRKYNFYKIDL